MSVWKYGEWFIDKEQVVYRWATFDLGTTGTSDETFSVDQIQDKSGKTLTIQNIRDVYIHKGSGGNIMDSWARNQLGFAGAPTPEQETFYQNLKHALKETHGYMGELAQEALSVDQTDESIAESNQMDVLSERTINAVIDNEKFFEVFFVDPSGWTPGATILQPFMDLFKLRVTFQVRRTIALAVTDGALESITEAEWKAIEKWPEILSNELFLKLLMGPTDRANKVLNFMPLWQVLVQLGLFPKKLDHDVTHIVKGYGGGLGGEPEYANVSHLWIPEPGRTGPLSDPKHQPRINATPEEIAAENLKYASELQSDGIHNVKFTGKGLHPKHGRVKLERHLTQSGGGNAYCNDLWVSQLRTPRGKAIVVSEMRLPTKDSVEQTKSFFTEDLVSLASLKMKRYNGDVETVEYINKAETDYGILDDGIEISMNALGSLFNMDDVNVYDDPGMLASILSRAYKKFLIQAVKVKDRSAGRATLQTQWDAITVEVAKVIYPIVLQNIENAFRVALWGTMRAYRQDDERCGKRGKKPPTEEEIEEAANDALKNNKDPNIEAALTEQDLSKGIDGRQKFFKQCALMRNIARLKGEFTRRLENEIKESKGKPFDGRFFMAKSLSDQGKIINGLVSSKHSATFFEIPPSVLSYLVPKIKLFRVYEDKGRIKETEFIFPQSTDIDKQKNFTNVEPESTKSFLSAPFDKGDGVGIKDFSFSFNGTNPAESRNDITAKLTLFFQTFGDFVKERISSDGNTYKFVDLVIQPVKKERINIPVVHANQYDPSFYRIRAEIGYANPREDLSELTTPGFGPLQMEQLDLAIQNTNKSYYLNMVDHDITVNPDGSVEVKISYRAYIESAMKSPRFDALSTPAMIKKRRRNHKNLQDLLATGRCSQQMISEFKATMDAEEIILRKRALQSIIRRLMDRRKVYNCKISEADAEHFRTHGYFKTCRLHPTHTETPCGGKVNKKSTTDFILSSIGVPDTEDFDFTDVEDVIIQYFFFGDLLYTVMDSMYDKVNGKTPAPGAENMAVILGSFDLDAFGKQVPGVNIAEIPISVDYFMTWYVNNVLIKGTTRKTFPILDFIRNLSNKLLQKTMLESCSNVALVSNLRFHTGQLMAYSEEGGDPLKKIVGWDGEKPNLFVMCDGGDKREDVLPLKGDASSIAKVANFYNYMFLNVVGSNLTYTGRGKYEEDINNGRYHIHIGSNRGIVKTVSFEKTDMEYVREARMFQNGIDGLLQLSNVYTANVEMFGNTIFYPGMELYINPYGVGGTIMGSPTRGRDHGKGASIANKLGFGGYHTIVGVDSSISPGKFSTSVRAQWYYAGDGIVPANRNGSKLAVDDGKPDPLSGSKDNLPGGFCSNAVVLMEDDIVKLLDGSISGFTIDQVPESMEPRPDAPEVDPGNFESDPIEKLPTYVDTDQEEADQRTVLVSTTTDVDEMVKLGEAGIQHGILGSGVTAEEVISQQEELQGEEILDSVTYDKGSVAVFSIGNGEYDVFVSMPEKEDKDETLDYDQLTILLDKVVSSNFEGATVGWTINSDGTWAVEE